MVADSPHSRVMRELSIRHRYGRASRNLPGDSVVEPAQPRQFRPAPPMRLVTKGWWTMREEQVNVEDLERTGRDRLEHAYADVVELAVAAAGIVLLVMLGASL